MVHPLSPGKKKIQGVIALARKIEAQEEGSPFLSLVCLVRPTSRSRIGEFAILLSFHSATINPALGSHGE